jgi:hypothetical protein
MTTAQRDPALRIRKGPGRPAKYGRVAQPRTITLPEDILVRLAAIDPDLGRAIVTLTERRRAPSLRRRPVELAVYGTRAIILVTPVPALKRMTGVQLVPIGAGRALISVDEGRSCAQLELEVQDALQAGRLTHADRLVMRGLLRIMRRARHSAGVSIHARSIIVLQRNGRR